MILTKTRKMMTGITSTALMLGLSGCGSESQEIPPPPEDSSCTDWEWDEDDGVWECDDSRSSYYRHYYYGGQYFKNKTALYKSKDFLNYKSSSSFKGGSNSESGQKSSGFGSGKKSYGG
ncbi:aminotransferase yhxA [Cytobacillus oceanisediminis]|uniref:aminotransferase yhxA n=1 Tax=Cytobacillus oceanisediminis TaxID=665099 RepID=UPI0021632ADA|nr:aminotransferase yhxA [Cytobacillus oceanisediminis]MCS0788013.1 aminotransferase yhxA [Cytobacillus firmus]MDF2038413.1 aminotransferase yhxA [Cytobacillus oceanisediminis]